MVQTSGDIIEIMGSCRVSNFVKNTIPTYYKHTLVGFLASEFLGWTWNTHVGIPVGIAKIELKNSIFFGKGKSFQIIATTFLGWPSSDFIAPYRKQNN